MGGNVIEQRIDAIDIFARTLYLRAKQNPDQTDIADAVRQLHSGLRHLRVEASDPDSLLCDPSSVYYDQLRPLIEDCARTLRHLEHAFNDEGRGLGSVKAQLKGRKATMDNFLDTVQLQNSKNRPSPNVVNPAEPGLDRIKDTVDQVAKKIFQRRDSGLGDDEDTLWKEFQAELENEGFHPAVLRKHKDVLRAYIRGVDALSTTRGGSPPSVRGILADGDNTSTHSSPKPKSTRPIVEHHRSSRDSIDSTQSRRDTPPTPPPKIPLHAHSPSPSPPQRRSTTPAVIMGTGNRNDAIASMSVISTKDLMAMDSLTASVAGMRLRSASNSPRMHSPPTIAQRRQSFRESTGHLPSAHGSPVVGSLSGFSSASSSPTPGGLSLPARQRLAPDRYGNPIAPDAEWTKLSRDYVSPQVLERAKVRYEARPNYVAILGQLNKDQIADFARQTADCRAARNIRQFHRSGSNSSRDDDDESESDSDRWHRSDSTNSDDDKTSEKGTKSYPFIVSPPLEKTPAPTNVAPKSILKNKNTNHVHFTPEPQEMESPRTPPRQSRRDYDERDERDRSRDHRRRVYREDSGSGRSHRESSDRYYRGDHSDEWDHHQRARSSSYTDDRDYYYYNNSHSSRERERERSRRPHHESDSRRPRRKSAVGDALGAAGLGGAAVSLLGVLAEAAGS